MPGRVTGWTRRIKPYEPGMSSLSKPTAVTALMNTKNNGTFWSEDEHTNGSNGFWIAHFIPVLAANTSNQWMLQLFLLSSSFT